jgi:hypothetical protein
MPRILIVADTVEGGDAAVFLAERVMTVQLDDPHFAAQLVERLRWAGEDAERAATVRDEPNTAPRRDPNSA